MLELAARQPNCSGCTSTIDPVIGKLLSDIRNSTGNTGGITQLTDPNLQRFTYNPSGFSTTKRPTVRFDFNLTDKHHLETSWTYRMAGAGRIFSITSSLISPVFRTRAASRRIVIPAHWRCARLYAYAG